MSNYINDAIQIDFPLSKTLKDLIREAEELDAKRDTEYFCVASMIDVIAKENVALGKLTRNQWDLLCEKYPQD